MTSTRRTFLQLLGLASVGAACVPSLELLETLAPGLQLTLDTDSLPFYLLGAHVVTPDSALVELCVNGMPFMYLTTVGGDMSSRDALDGLSRLRGHLTVRATRAKDQKPCSVYATLTTIDAEYIVRGNISEIIHAPKQTHLLVSEIV